MTRRRARPRVPRALGLFVLTALFCISLALFPHKSRGQSKSRDARDAGTHSSVLAASPAEEPQSPPPTPGAAHGAVPAATNPRPPELEEEATIPMGRGLPVVVRVAFFFLELKELDDTKGEFEAITDMRLHWSDLRLAYPAQEAARGYKEYRGSAADKRLATIWKPHVEPTNRLEVDDNVGRRVRIFPNGDVETIERRSGRYKIKIDAQRFPFDRQFLKLEYIVREDTTDSVVLDFENEDVEWSRTAKDAELAGWRLGLVDLSRSVVPGWNGDRYSRVAASLFVDRLPTTGIAPIFIPLIASLLIPLLAIWMNKATEDGFEIEAFELANISIGGLFSVIALSFAIYSSYGMIAGGDNTVTRLFGLNYMTLALSLSVVIAFYRFNFPRRLFGRYVEEQLFLFICWALPILTLGTSIAFLLVAAA